MTCKDCIHYEICKISHPISVCMDGVCSFYKDKARFIELPCKVGDMVYMHNRNKTMVQEMVLEEPDIRCHCTRDDEFSCCMPVCIDPRMVFVLIDFVMIFPKSAKQYSSPVKKQKKH